ncbi:MAG: hypothetical protein WC796_06420 [Candidatus Pacearchaeota archaeon]|jgi:hypothetical protein
MVVAKILGALDIFSAIIVWIAGMFNFLPKEVMIVVGIYLLIKGAIFLASKDLASVIDVICAAFIFASAATVLPKFIYIIIAIYLLQKGIFSIVAH